MLFTSASFIAFFLVIFGLYYLPILSKIQVQILIIGSLFFYAYEAPILLILLLSSAFINIFCSYYVFTAPQKYRFLIASTGVILNLLILAFFKYGGFLVNTLNLGNNEMGHFIATLPLPIGISFFTFEGISLLVDSLKDDYFKKNHSSIKSHSQNTLLFISFFPHLIAGPILKAHQFFPQIHTKHFKNIAWEAAIKDLIIGYFLKCVVADNLKEFTVWISYPYFQVQSSLSLIAMLFGYSFQIFADFAGYSLIAIGLAKLLGYNFLANFNFPYTALSFSDFWRRWHISLSTFLKEYLYIPLGGNRHGEFRTYLNLILTMFLGGLWHGAAWSYAVWGLAHGLALAVERFLMVYFGTPKSKAYKIIKAVFVFMYVTLVWLLFKLPNFKEAIQYLKCIRLNYSNHTDYAGLIFFIGIYSLPVVFYHANYMLRNRISLLKYKPFIYAIMLFLIITNSGSLGKFIYFQF